MAKLLFVGNSRVPLPRHWRLPVAGLRTMLSAKGQEGKEARGELSTPAGEVHTE